MGESFGRFRGFRRVHKAHERRHFISHSRWPDLAKRPFQFGLILHLLHLDSLDPISQRWLKTIELNLFRKHNRSLLDKLHLQPLRLIDNHDIRCWYRSIYQDLVERGRAQGRLKKHFFRELIRTVWACLASLLRRHRAVSSRIALNFWARIISPPEKRDDTQSLVVRELMHQALLRSGVDRLGESFVGQGARDD